MEKQQRLERIINDRVLGGVCSGLGYYLNIDPTIIRLIFCISFFVFGIGLFVYIILWIAMPANNEGKASVSKEGSENENIQNRRQASSGNGNMTIGIILIALGILLLACNFIPTLSLRKLWPFAIVAIGITLIVNALKKKEQ